MMQNATTAAPTGRKKFAQGKERSEAALGHDSTHTWSAEAAKNIESQKPGIDAGQMLLQRILKNRREGWRGPGKYKEPVAPNLANLPKLPVGWCWAGTEQVTAGIDNAITIGPFGSNLMVKDYEDSGVPLIFVREIRSEKFRRHDTRYISSEKAAKLSAHKVRGGDVLITKMGDPPGDTAIYPETLSNAIATSDCIKLTPNPEAATATFLKYAIRSRPVKDQIERVTQGVAQKKVSLARFKTVAVPLAPLSEQRRIVAKVEKQFTRLDAGVAALQRLQANLKRYRAAVLKTACEGKLVPTEAELRKSKGKGRMDFETGEQLLGRILVERRKRWTRHGKYKEPDTPNMAKLPPLPNGWAWARLEQLGATFSGLTKNPKRDKLPKQLPYLRVANVYANELRLEEIERIGVEDPELEKLLLHVGDLLIVEGNGSKDQIGRLAIWDGSIDPCVHQNHLIKVRPVQSRMSKWVLYWLQSPAGRQFVEMVASSTSGLYTLSVGKVGDLPVAIPPLAEQTRIVAEVERRLSMVEELEAMVSTNLQRAARLRQSILQTAFTAAL